MLNIPSACLEALKADAVQSIQIKVAPLRGGEFYITENDIAQGGFTYDNDLINGDTLQIGAMTAAEVKITLENADGRFNGVWFAGAILTVKLRIPLENGQYEVLPFGVYTVNEQPRTATMISLTAYDNLMRLDVPFDPSVFPPSYVSEQDIVQAAMRACGLQCNDYSMFRSTTDVEVAKISSESTITWRQVIMWCCQLNCVNGIADENGYICFKFYEKYVPKPLQTEAAESLETEYGDLLLADEVVENDFPITAAERYMDGSTFDEEDCVITGHQFKDGDALYPADANMEYGIQTENNLVWSASVRKEEKAAALNEEIAGFTYFPYQCNITPFPHLQLMDGIDYVRNGTHHHSIITNLQFTLNGGMTIAAKAKSKVQKGWASIGALTPGQQAIIDSISHKITNTQADLDAREQYLLQFNETIAGSMGLYTTYKPQEDGSVVLYMHDEKELEQSQTIYTFGTNGFAWTNTGWNDGNPVWETGFDRNGNAILNAIYAYTLTADVITSGTLRSQNGASSINLNDGTFSFGCFVPTGDMDLDTLQPVYKREEVLTLSNNILSVYGVLKSLAYPQYAVSIGPSEFGDYGALTVTYDAEGYGDIFQAYPTRWYNESDPDTTTDRGVTITAPFTFSGDGDRRGLQINSNEIKLMNKKLLGSAMLAGAQAWISAFRDNINLSTNASHRHCWFNYYQPKYGYSPVAYDFGNGAGAHADVLCAGLECDSLDCSGGATIDGSMVVYGATQLASLRAAFVTVDGYMNVTNNITTSSKLAVGRNAFYNEHLSVFGSGRADSWLVTSDPSVKENVVEQTPNALKKLLTLKFYSYDINPNKIQAQTQAELNAVTKATTSSISEPNDTEPDISSHIKMGIMATDAPEEIQTEDGTGIDLYSYISMCAKAIQELAEKCDAQEQRIAALEAKIAGLES